MGWILLGVVLVLGLGVALLYNGLVTARRRADNAWAQIEVHLRRRHDLIPKLVDTVQGDAAYEREALEALTSARAGAIAADGVAERARAENVVSSASRSLFAGPPAYPGLEASQSFLALHEELLATGGRIAYAGLFYNDTVARYNTKIESFPARLLARPLHFRAGEHFEADDTSRPVRVDA
jgi:LemA protein